MKNNRFYITVAVIAAFCVAPSAALAKPSIGAVTYPSNLEANQFVTLSATVSSSQPIQSCSLYVDSSDKGTMTVSGGKATKSYSFPYSQVYTVFVFCRDTSGGIASGPPTAIWVKVGPKQSSEPFGGAEPETISEPESEGDSGATSTEASVFAFGDLIKLECPEDSEADHPCRSVYYYGQDGKRYAFPNAKVFFTWYENFDGVKIVTSEELGAIQLGGNVRYRPGVRMVKFTTLNRVYAVSKGGILRWIMTEEVATALYGEDWNTQIDDIADTFYGNYTFGEDIAEANGYARASEQGAASTIDANRE